MEKESYIQIKVYDRTATTLKQVIPGNLVLSEIAFTANINGGQGELVLSLARPITYTGYSLGDVVQVDKYGHQEQRTSGVNDLTWDEIDETWDEMGNYTTWDELVQENSPTIYSGYISKIGRKQTGEKELIEITLLGTGSLLTEQETTKTFDGKSSDVLIKELIDAYALSYGEVIRYTDSSITVGVSLGDGQVEGTYMSCIQKICELVNMKFYIDADRIINVFQKPLSPTHSIANKSSIESIEINEDIESLVNSFEVVTSSTPVLTSTYEDAASIALYGKRYKKETSTLYGQTTIDDYVINYVNQNKGPKKETVLVVNREYVIEYLKPGDTVKIRNFAYDFDNVQIEKISYSEDRCTVYLDKYESFGKQVLAIAK